MPTEDSTGTRLRAWERATEWPLTGAAVVFLGAYAWEVLTNAQGGAKNAAEMVIDAVWALFGVDYLVRLALAPNRGHWFLHHLPDLAVIALPVLRVRVAQQMAGGQHPRDPGGQRVPPESVLHDPLGQFTRADAVHGELVLGQFLQPRLHARAGGKRRLLLMNDVCVHGEMGRCS